ncbi:beta-phosphoglucomutase family hydrolase [Dactylosporangium sp. NPDC049525]|uniref:HAD family hydrolase n=1 Tax=Dactylosporangium sp. NPDC049525 TaxID=3154730 RepID=UPI00343BBDC6
MLGLPEHVTACLFDLDGVLTPTAVIHNKAWTRTFDDFLRGRDGQRPFDPVEDYNDYVDGKPREAGVRDFLASRGITLPEGTPDDPPDAPTVNGLGNRKNELLLTLIEEGLEPYPGSVRYLEEATRVGLRRAVVSSSANTLQVVTSTGLDKYLEVRVDGSTIKERGLRGKPAPDTFLAAAQELGVTPEQAAVFEDAISGVAAGKAGGFGFVVGVDRIGNGHAEDLRAAGADVVVTDLDALLEG